jgi:hypothetical protein
MYPHRIRLRGPWERQPAVDGGQRYRRRFGYPGRIDAHERVWLTFAGIGGRAVVWLNDCLLGCHPPLYPPPRAGGDKGGDFEFEVTALLRPRNELVVDVEGTVDQGGSWGEVALEIRCTAFLRDLRRLAVLRGERVELHVGGQVVGTAERPLELYVVVDRSTAAYRVVTPAVEGQPFEIVVPDLAAEMGRSADGSLSGPLVKVDLVNGASIWYTSAEQVTFEKMGE